MTKGNWRIMELFEGKTYEDSMERSLQISGGRILCEFRRAVLSLLDGCFRAGLRLLGTARSQRRALHHPLHLLLDLLLSGFHPKGAPATAAPIAESNCNTRDSAMLSRAWRG